MPKKKQKLTPAELTEIEQLEKQLKGWFDPKKDGDPMKLGDIYLEEWKTKWHRDPKSNYKCNCHGVPRRFKVVYVSPDGISFLKELSGRGNFVGNLRLPHRLEVVRRHGTDKPKSNWGFSPTFDELKWTLDPGHLDSILLDQSYDPTADTRETGRLFAEVNRHNKAVAITTRDANRIAAYLVSLKPGDKFWMSPTNVFVVELVYKDAVGLWTVRALDKNQERQVFTCKDLMWRRLYREQPRSFRAETKQEVGLSEIK